MEWRTPFALGRPTPHVRFRFAPRRILAFLAAASTGLVGCGDSTGPGTGGQPDFNLAVIVQGTVTDAAGDEVFEAAVDITTFEYDGECSDQPVGPVQSTTVSESGSYSKSLTYDLEDEFDACLRIEVTPPPGSGLRPQFAVRVDVEIRELEEGVEVVEANFVLQS